MEMEEENKRNKSRNRGRARGARTRGKTRGQRKKAVKVIESDDEDISQAGDENPMDTSTNEQETKEETAQTQTQQPTIPHTQQSQHVPSMQPMPPQHAQHTQPPHHPVMEHKIEQQNFDLEADISQLEAPTFTTINRGPPEPMLRLQWKHRVNLIGEKVLNPMIHCCDKCLKPILIYGRMIPCKHVFCLLCAKREDKVCPRCMEKVSRVEQTGLGTVFMCTHGGTRYGNAGCRRTYLSQRDLQAHINHRHVAAPPPQTVQAMQLDGPSAYMQHSKGSDMLLEAQLMKTGGGPNNRMKSMVSAGHMVPSIVMGNDPRVNSIGVGSQQSDHRSSQQHRHYSQSSASSQQQQSASVQMRSNLITVNIQDTTSMSSHDLQQQSHHYYHPDNHVNASLTARHVVLSNQAPPPAPTQVGYGYGVSVGPPAAQNQQYYSPQHAHPVTQLAYAVPQQQQYVPSVPSRSGYVQDTTYGAPGQQPPLPPQPQQQQWGQHQQQFYR